VRYILLLCRFALALVLCSLLLPSGPILSFKSSLIEAVHLYVSAVDQLCSVNTFSLGSVHFCLWIANFAKPPVDPPSKYL